MSNAALQLAIKRARMTPRAPASPMRLIAPPAPVVQPKVAAVVNPEAKWVERQKQIHAAPKPYWFSIVDEVDRRPRIEDIQRAVAKHFGVTRDDLICARRTADIVLPRQVAVYLSKNLTLKSLPEIGRRFGGRDHTTALSSVRKVTRLLTVDPELVQSIAMIKQDLGVSQ